MRLIDVFQPEDYQPLERGEAFPQYYENGDRYEWHHPMMWNYYFWREGCWEIPKRHNEFDSMWLMGGEL